MALNRSSHRGMRVVRRVPPSASAPTNAFPPGDEERALMSSSWSEKLLKTFASVLLLTMTMVVFIQITNRYIFGSPLAWTEEIARMAFIWMTPLGALFALMGNGHIAIETFIKRICTESTQHAVRRVFTYLILFFLCFFFWTSIQVLLKTYESTTPILEISYLYIHISIPIFTFLMVLFLLGQIVRMGAGRAVIAGLIAAAAVAILYLLFGIKSFSGPAIVLVAIVCMGVMIYCGMPIVFSMAIACGAFFMLFKKSPAVILHTRMLGGIDSFPLLAVPFFILAGELLNTGGVTQRLVDLAKVLVGHVRGGLGMVVVLGEYFFSGISGSTVADVSAIGSLLVPGMKRAGYSSEDTVSIISAATAMGILVPPCIPMVVLGGMTGMSVGALFAAGFLPAIILALCILVLIYFQAVRRGFAVEKRLSFQESRRAVTGAIIPLLCPVIIFAGILSGAATATEISVVAVVYAFIVGVFVYREIAWRDIVPILVRTVTTTGAVMLLVGFASVLSWIFATNQIPQMVAGVALGISSSPFVFLLLSNLCFILLGAVLEGVPAMLILVPIFLPLSTQLGVDPLHFGILVVASLGIGLFLPPLGMGIFIACTFAEIDVGKVFGSFAPFLIALLVGLVIISAVPWITLVIPKLFFT
jgi:tripartite ATP-independent transporter DctM subunit